MTASHDTFTRRCLRDALWYVAREYPEELFLHCLVDTDAVNLPFIQRQAYCEKVHYFFLKASHE